MQRGDTATDFNGRSFTIICPLIFGGFVQWYKTSRPPYFIESSTPLYECRAVIVEKCLNSVVDKSAKKYPIQNLFL